MISDLHQISRQPIRLHCSGPGFHSTQRHWYIHCHLQHTTNTVEYKFTTVMAEHTVLAHKQNPRLKTDHAISSWSCLTMTHTHAVVTFVQHYNSNNLHSENNNLGRNWCMPHHLTATSRVNHLCSIDKRTHLLSTRRQRSNIQVLSLKHWRHS